jgi:GT2 family glycosyltransferase
MQAGSEASPEAPAERATPPKDVPARVRVGASVLIVNWNGREHLEACLAALRAQNYRDHEVILVDNASSDGSVDFVRERFPEVRVLETGTNLGYAGGNNRGLELARGRYVAVLNADTEVAPTWLAELIAAIERARRATPERPVIVTSKVLMFDPALRDEVNTCGNAIHLSGLTFCRGLGQPSAEFLADEPVPAISGCAFAARREVFDQIGLFDAALFMSMEDTDLSLRAQLAGVECLLAAKSVVFHKYDLRLHPGKLFLLERNRWIMLLKHYRWRTLLLLAPTLLLAELLTWGFALLRGGAYPGAKLAAARDVLASSGRWRAERRRVQALRAVTDAELLRLSIDRIPYRQLTASHALQRLLGATVDPLFALQRRIALALVRW